MLIAIIIVAAAITAAWSALITQSLSSGGSRIPYFTSEICCHFPPDNDDYIILDADFGFVDSNGDTTTAHKGLESDGASVGSLLWIPIIGSMVVQLIKGTPLTGPLRPGAIPHDELYARAEDTSLWKALVSPARAHADRIIFEASRCQTYKLGAFEKHRIPLAAWRAFIVMALLRVFGAKAWIDDSRASRSLAKVAA